MDVDNIQLCTKIVQFFDTGTQVLIGAILTILVNIIMLIRVYLSTRKPV